MTDVQKPLAGRTALVTGSGRNIGKAVALRLALAGAHVVVNGSRDRAAIDEVARSARESGVKALAVLADVSDPEACEAMFAEAEREIGPIDILVSNVGIRRHQPFLQISVEDWRRVIDTNLSAAFYLSRVAVPGMKERGWGRIMHVSGFDGFTGHMTDRAHNVACKAGLHGFSKALARELGPFGITVNTVVPGAINTERDWSQYPNVDVEAVARRIPVRRWGEVGDIAEACLWLAGEGAGFVNGQAIHLNGGEFMF